jgi:hypothetical protein
MNKILFASVTLFEDEVVVWHRLSGMWQKQWRNVGGQLILTNKRLIFTPHRFDRILMGKVCQFFLDDIVSIQIKEPYIIPNNIRRLLSVETKTSEEGLFIPNWIDDTYHVLLQAINEIDDRNHIPRPVVSGIQATPKWYVKLILPTITAFAIYFLYLGIHLESVGDVVISTGGFFTLFINLIAYVRHRKRRKLDLPFDA